jgi:hypothetical protein
MRSKDHHPAANANHVPAQSHRDAFGDAGSHHVPNRSSTEVVRVLLG